MDPDGFKALRYRMGGPGAEILRRLGATVVVLPGGEIMPALRSGAIDAAEWIGPWLDMAIELHKTAAYYYYPGFHEPGTAEALGINKGVWERLAPSDRRLFEVAAACEYSRSLGEFNFNNALALRKLREEGIVQIRKFDNSLGSSWRSAERWSRRSDRTTTSRDASTRATRRSAPQSWTGATSPRARS